MFASFKRTLPMWVLAILWIFAFSVALREPRGQTPSDPPTALTAADRQFYLGMRANSASTPVALQFGVESPTGAVVTSVTPDGPAHRAGLRPGDLIVRFGDHEIESLEDLIAAASLGPFGVPQPVSFVRGQRRFETKFVVQEHANPEPSIWYSHPEHAYRFRLPATWSIREREPGVAVEETPFDVVESHGHAYRLDLFRVGVPVSSGQGLEEFISQRKLQHADCEIVRGKIGEVPAAWAAYSTGVEQRVAVYDIAFVLGGKRYEIRAIAPPLSMPDALPLPLRHLFQSFEATTHEASPNSVSVSPVPTVEPPEPTKVSEAGTLSVRAGDATLRLPATWRSLGSDVTSPIFGIGSSASFAVLRRDRPDDFLGWIVAEYAAIIEAIDNVDVGGSPAIMIAFSSEKQGRKGVLFASEKKQSDGRAIAFLAMAPTDKFDVLEPEFTKVIHSIQFESSRGDAEPRGDPR